MAVAYNARTPTGDFADFALGNVRGGARSIVFRLDPPRETANGPDSKISSRPASVLDVFTPPPDSSTRRRIVTSVGPLFLLYLMYTTVRYFVRERGPQLGLHNATRV